MQAGAKTNALNLTQTMLNMNARPPCKQITKHMVNPGDQWFPTPKPVCNIDTCTHMWTCWHYSSHTCARAFFVRVRHSMSLHPLILVTHMPTFQTNFVKISKPRSRNRTPWRLQTVLAHDQTVQNQVETVQKIPKPYQTTLKMRPIFWKFQKKTQPKCSLKINNTRDTGKWTAHGRFHGQHASKQWCQPTLATQTQMQRQHSDC